MTVDRTGAVAFGTNEWSLVSMLIGGLQAAGRLKMDRVSLLADVPKPEGKQPVNIFPRKRSFRYVAYGRAPGIAIVE
jgi:hypothetical protein